MSLSSEDVPESWDAVVGQLEHALVLERYWNERDALMAQDADLRLDVHWRELPGHAEALSLRGEAAGNLVAAFLWRASRPEGHSTAQLKVLDDFFHRVVFRPANRWSKTPKYALAFTLSETALRVCAMALVRCPSVMRAFTMDIIVAAMVKAVRAKTSSQVKEEVRQASRSIRTLGRIKEADRLASKLPRLAVDAELGLDLDAGVGVTQSRYSPVATGRLTVERAWRVWADGRQELWRPRQRIIEVGLALRGREECPTELTDVQCQAAVFFHPIAGIDLVCLTEGPTAALQALAFVEQHYARSGDHYTFGALSCVLKSVDGWNIPAWPSGWSRLGQHVKQLEPSEYEGFVAAAHAAAEAANDAVQACIYMLLEDPERCRQSAASLGRDSPPMLCVWGVRLGQMSRPHATVIGSSPVAIAAFARRFGADGLRELTNKARTGSGRALPSLLQVACAIPEVDTAKFLITYAEGPSIRGIVLPFLKRWPDVALQALSESPSLPKVLRDFHDKLRAKPTPKAKAPTDVPAVLAGRTWAKKVPSAPPIDTSDWEMTYEVLAGDPPVIQGQLVTLPPVVKAKTGWSPRGRTVEQLLQAADDALLERTFNKGRGLITGSTATDAQWRSLAVRLGVASQTDQWFDRVGHRFPLCVTERITSPWLATKLEWRWSIPQWAERYPVAAAKGLIWGTQLKTAERKAHLAALVRLNDAHPEAVAEAASQLHPKMSAWLKTLLERCPDGEFPPPSRKVPSWVPADLPALVDATTGELTSQATVRLFVENLASTPKDRVPYGLQELRKLYTSESLAALVWVLLDHWASGQAPSKDAWTLDALGHFGDDDTLAKLRPRIHHWIQMRLRDRVSRLISAFVRVGSDDALELIRLVQKKATQPTMVAAAQEGFVQFAAARGLSGDQLEDRLIPTLGLGPDGSRILDFGGRTFRVGFDDQHVPFVVDVASGDSRSRLPAAGKNDDPLKAESATELWKQLRKLARQTDKEQVTRLERAMLSGRRWSVAEFESVLVHHPFMGALCRSLLWGVYDEERCVSTFRVSEDRTFADVDDDPFVLPQEATIGLPYCADLDPTVVTAWTDVWSDYELIQPIDQLHRVVLVPSAEDVAAGKMRRYVSKKVFFRRIQALEKRGWIPEVGRHGIVGAYTISMGTGCSATLVFQPGIETRGEVNGEQTLDVVLLRGVTTDPSVRVSEMMRDLDWLTAKSL